MKLSILSLASLAPLATLAAPQAPPMPTQFAFARCGMNTIISGIAQSGCSVSDAACLCKAKSFVKASTETIPKKCPAKTDQDTFINFINIVCAGQQGYPIYSKEGAKASSANSRSSPAIWSALGAAAAAALL